MSDTGHFLYSKQGFYGLKPLYVDILTKLLNGRPDVNIGDINIHKTIVDSTSKDHNYSYGIVQKPFSLVIKPRYRPNDQGNMVCLPAVVIKATEQHGRDYEAFYAANGTQNLAKLEEVFGPILDSLHKEVEKTSALAIRDLLTPPPAHPHPGR